MEYDQAFYARNLRPEFIETDSGQKILDFVGYVDRMYAAVFAGEQRLARPTLDPSLVADLASELAFTASQAEAVLRKVNPRSVEVFDLFDDVLLAASWGQDLREGGLSQCIWAVGVAGAGSAAPGGYLTRFLRCFAYWRATHLLTDYVQEVQPESFLTHMVGSTGPRLIPTAASFWWASRELATLIARHTPDNILTEADVTELADYVDRTTSTALWRQGQCDIATLSPAARRIAGSCSYGYGSQAGKPFQKMLVQRDIELHPFVDVDGVMIPAALQKIHEGFHVALFHALRKQHKHTVDTAQLFELVCRDTLARLFSQSTTILPDRMHIYDSCGVQLGETDFAIAHGSVLILGEVKSKAAPGEVLMNGERFTDQITETIKQLDKAVDNLTNNGATLVANGQRVDTEGISTFIGIAVVLHDYGGGIWQGKVLHEVRQGRRGFAILRAVDLMLLAHTLRDMDELIDYLSFRQEFMDCYGFSVDEVDILAAFLGNARRYRHFFRQVNLVHKNVIPLPPRDVERELLISPTPPARLGPWRATVANFTKTVANFNT